MKAGNALRKPEETAALLKKYVSETFLYDRPGFVLTNETALVAQRVIDSLQIFQLITFLEERLGFSVEAEDTVLENFASIEAITNLVHRQQTAAQ